LEIAQPTASQSGAPAGLRFCVYPLNQFYDDIFRPPEKGNPEFGNVGGGHEKGIPLRTEICESGLDVFNFQTDVVVAVYRSRGIPFDLLVSPGCPQVDGGALQIQGGPIGGPELFALDQLGADAFAEKPNHFLEVLADDVHMMETKRHGGILRNLNWFWLMARCPGEWNSRRIAKTRAPAASDHAGSLIFYGIIFTITGPISIDFSCLLGVYFHITLVSKR
jgi:hypothetical protein